MHYPSLSSIAYSISEINKRECKACMERNDIKSECDFMGIKYNQLSYICKKCNKKWLKFVNELIKKFSSIYQFCNGDLNKFVLLLRKGVYPYEDMDTWERFNKNKLPSKEAFYSELNLENITDKEYAHAQNIWKVFEIKSRAKYHDWYVRYDTLLLGDVFENFRDKCIKSYELDPAYFVSASGLAWQACLKNTGVNIELITHIYMLLMVEEGVTVEYVKLFIGMLKQTISI